MKREQTVLIAIIILVCFLQVVSSLETPPGIEWQKELDLNYGYASMIKGNDGGYVVVGYVVEEVLQVRSLNVLVLKLDSEGNEVWKRIWGGPNKNNPKNPYTGETSRDWDRAFFVIPTLDNGYLVGGTTEFYARDYGESMFLLKLNNEGDISWSKTYQNISVIAFSAIQNPDGSYVVAYPTGLLKVDNLGNEIWNKTINFQEKDNINTRKVTVRKDSQEGYVVVGLNNIVKTDYEGNIEWKKDLEIKPHSFLVDKGGDYVISGEDENSTQTLIKMRKDSFLWQIKLNTSSYFPYAQTSLIEDPQGGYILLGENSTHDRVALEYGILEDDGYIAKISSEGKLVWRRELGLKNFNCTERRDYPQAITGTDDNGFFIVGLKNFVSFLERGCSPRDDLFSWYTKLSFSSLPCEENWICNSYGGCVNGTKFCVNVTDINNCNLDYLGDYTEFTPSQCNSNVAPTNKEKNYSVEWERNYSLSLYDNIRGATATSDGGYILVGYSTTWTEVLLDYGEKNSWLVETITSPDAWIIKTDSHGNLEWNITYGRLEPYDNKHLVIYNSSVRNNNWDAAEEVIESDGIYFIAGKTSIYAADNTDAFLMKINNGGDIEWTSLFDDKLNYSTEYGLSIFKSGDKYILEVEEYSPYGDSRIKDVLFDSRGVRLNETWKAYRFSYILGDLPVDWKKILSSECDISDLNIPIKRVSRFDEGYVAIGFTDCNTELPPLWIGIFDEEGNLIKNNTFNEIHIDRDLESKTYIGLAKDGNFIVTGEILTDFGFIEGIKHDAFLAKITKEGELLWYTKVGQREKHLGLGIFTKDLGNGGYVIAGSTQEITKDNYWPRDYWLTKIRVDEDCIYDGSCENYSICGDSVCSLQESCSSCSPDCGGCPSSGGSNIGSSSSSGGGRSINIKINSTKDINATNKSSTNLSKKETINTFDENLIESLTQKNSEEQTTSVWLSILNFFKGAPTGASIGVESGSSEKIYGFIVLVILIMGIAGVVIWKRVNLKSHKVKRKAR